MDIEDLQPEMITNPQVYYLAMDLFKFRVPGGEDEGRLPERQDLDLAHHLVDDSNWAKIRDATVRETCTTVFTAVLSQDIFFAPVPMSIRQSIINGVDEALERTFPDPEEPGE